MPIDNLIFAHWSKMTQKKNKFSKRTLLSNKELEDITADDFARIKLSDEEKEKLREINLKRQSERDNLYKLVLAEQSSILAEINKAGLQIKELNDLVGKSERYTTIIPILLKHLQKPYSDITKEIIARALAVPELLVKNAWPIIIEEYRKAPHGYGFRISGETKKHRLGAKDGLACVLAVIVSDETFHELINLVKDSTQGDSRVLLLSALKISKNPLARLTLEEISNDPDLSREIEFIFEKNKFH